MSEWHNIGRISPVPAGTWNSAKAYKRLDIVTDSKGEKSYIALKDVPSGTTLSNAAYWQLIVDNASATINAVNRLTSPFSKNGDVVVCNPVEQHPLNAKSIVAPVQVGSGDPSPSNVRPISGFTGAKLTKCGKNLLPPVFGSKTNNGVTFTVNSDGTVTANGTATATAIAMFDAFMLPAGDYVLSGGGTVWVGLEVTDANGTKRYYASTSYVPNYNFTLTGTETGIRSYFRVDAGITANNLTAYPMIRLASIIDAAYEPYHGETFSSSFGQTVYGGTMDWNKGEMVVEWAAIDGGTRNWSVYNDGVQVFLADGNPTKIFGAFNIISSHYKTSKSALVSQMDNMEIKGSQSSGAIFVRDTRYTDPAAFKAAMSGVQICYQIQTPIAIQLTPQQILGLKGVNTLYSDCGKTDVSGRIDPEWMNEQLKNAIIALGGNV